MFSFGFIIKRKISCQKNHFDNLTNLDILLNKINKNDNLVSLDILFTVKFCWLIRRLITESPLITFFKTFFLINHLEMTKGSLINQLT